MVKLKKMATIVVSVELVVTPVMGVEFTDSITIDMSRTATLETYKYDELAVRMAGVDVDTLNKADGEHDVNVETALAKYSLQDVQFTYLNIDDIITDTDAAAADADVFVEVVYSVENDLMKILGLQVKNAKKTGITAKRRLDYIWL